MIELRVPPLRERTGDLPQLAQAIIQRLAAGQGRAPPSLTGAAQSALAGYAFPGNVRELENILERTLALADGDSIDASDLHLPQAVARSAAAVVPPPAGTVLDLDPATGALPSYIEQLERAAIQKALEDNRWNKTRTAEQLGITFRALRYKLKKLGMD